MFITVKSKTVYEITEKKSKFIAQLMYVENKEDAENKIKEFKKMYHDARHNCFAYRVIDDGKIYEKSSDDGEPSGTAGAPMLSILQKNNLCNILAVVTRYFGGILLGTGGLVKCYSDSTIGAIEKAEKIEIEEGIELEVELEYTTLEAFRYYCKKNNINIKDIIYLESVVCKIEIECNNVDCFFNDIKNKKINIINNREIGKMNIVKVK